MNIPGVVSVVNCKKTPCPGGSECCSQEGANNGICVKDGFKCDRRLGLPDKKSRDKMGSNIQPSVSENFFVKTKEGYDENDECTDWSHAMFVLTIVFVLVVALVVIHMKNIARS